ncbi:MAG: Hpt domain-containing protein, partial [bacterium]
MDQSLKDFVAEAEDILDHLEESVSFLMDLGPDDHRKPDVINAIFRQAHSLKGLSGMFNLENLTGLSHKLENLLDSIRLDKTPLSPQAVEVLGHGTQLLVRMVRAISEGLDDDAVNISDFIRELEGLEKGIAKRDEEDLSL